ncbi:hypothetical protein TrVFT333_011685 [Trichoderma virens FT-333]|nr:hypothetical protein TrVFT333_011685 [Trichoderma virens FT-333]
MRSSALFALLPLASALPQAVPAVEVRDTRCQNKISNCSEVCPGISMWWSGYCLENCAGSSLWCNHNGWGFDKRSLEAGDATSQSEGAESCQAAHDSCKTACNWWPWEARWSYCLPLCSRQLDICTGNNPEKRFIEERDDAVETYPVPVESLPTETQPAQTQPTQTQPAESCEANLESCKASCNRFVPEMRYFLCNPQCYSQFNSCTGKTAEKRSVESLPAETQSADSCEANLDSCRARCDVEVPLRKWAFCLPACHRQFDTCTGQTEKRSVESLPAETQSADSCEANLDSCRARCDVEVPLRKWAFCLPACHRQFDTCTGNTHEKRYRGDYAQEITGCYSAVAKCKNEGHKSIEECYAPLNDCLQGLFDKYGIA